MPRDLDLSAGKSARRVALLVLLAVVLALTSVFRTRLTRALRLGAFLEGPLIALRTLQSGHFGDYVLWLTIGTATLGMAYVVLLR